MTLREEIIKTLKSAGSLDTEEDATEAILELFIHLIEEVIGEDDKGWTQKIGMALHNKAAKVRNILRSEQRLRLIEAVKGKV
jgi:hypothetical protein